MNHSSQGIKEIVSFTLSHERYGIDIMQVQEIIKMQRITPIPNSLDFVLGVINLRGEIIPVIDLKRRFQLISTELFFEPEIIIIELKDGKKIGIVVEKAREVLSIDINRVILPPPVISSVGREYILGMIKDSLNRLLIILDVNKLLLFQDIQAIRHIR